MHHFQYRHDELFCEDVPVREIAEAVGTPFYLYSCATLERHFKAFDGAFANADRLVCFSAKANASLAILKLLSRLGSGLDIVSGGELFRGLRAGIAPDKIVYSGVGKKPEEIDFALQSGILMFNIESLDELELINRRAGEFGKKAPIAIRVNPDVDPKTHPYISTGLKKNKFGIDVVTALEAYKAARTLENVAVVGIDCHIGSQITDLRPFTDALESLKDLIEELTRLGIDIRYLDMGGGLGITYDKEIPPAPDEYARAIVSALRGLPVKLILEPGRVIVGNAGILVTRLLYRKMGIEKNFLVVDAGMNDLMRPTLYQAFHAIQPVVYNTAQKLTADVVGPICETGDFLARDREIADVRNGDLLAVMSAGAYGFSMSSTYCSRPRVAEVMVNADRFYVIRARQGYEDLVVGENLPPFLKG
ncbi:MAG: diaminopimelate decarboxylase [Deltaproteobacteria bacterium]|jgi:diaminopimelate decarboxylase|nr:diaminopimelate decarboxylase [Deltaproteobacteria bacterium]